MVHREKSYDTISSTAKLNAHLRTFTDIPFAREIAEESGAEITFQELAGESSEALTRLAPYWEARYKITDRIVAQSGISQILEVAAGLSPRGLVMTSNPDVVYVVTDLPQILGEEKALSEKILSKSNSPRPNLRFHTLDALDRKSFMEIASLFRSSRPVAIITEGLLQYLNRKEIAVLATNIHTFLKIFGGVWITSDVHVKEEYAEGFSEVIGNVLQRISSSTQRNLEGNLFADDTDVRRFFDNAGFGVQTYAHSSV